MLGIDGGGIYSSACVAFFFLSETFPVFSAVFAVSLAAVSITAVLAFAAVIAVLVRIGTVGDSTAVVPVVAADSCAAVLADTAVIVFVFLTAFFIASVVSNAAAISVIVHIVPVVDNTPVAISTLSVTADADVLQLFLSLLLLLLMLPLFSYYSCCCSCC